MFSRFTYRQKTGLLIAASLLLLFVGYKIAISPTFKLLSKIDVQESKIEKAKTANSDISRSLKNLAVLKRKVGKTSPSFEAFQKELLNSVVPFAEKNKIKISEIKLPHKAPKNNYEIQTLQIECKASFKALTELLDHIQKENIGRVCSVNYELRKNHKLKRRFLYATFYVQNYLAL
jgi:hypothetical protein